MRIPRTAPARACVLIASVALSSVTWADTAYKLPPREVVDILDSPPPPVVVPSPDGESILLLQLESYPPIAYLARPILKLGGVRIDPATGCLQRTRRFVGIGVESLKDGKAHPIELPPGSMIQPPVWSPDGKRFAFTRDVDDGAELWVGETATGAAAAVPGVRLDDILGTPLRWVGDNRRLLVRAIPQDRGAAPAASSVPTGPNTQETSGKRSRMATFQDLLGDAHDEDLFEHFGTSQLAFVDAETRQVQRVGAPGMFAEADASPDGKYILVTRLHRPFSFRVPYEYFSRSTEVLAMDGSRVGVVVDLPVSDQVPQQGVPTGPREVQWQPLRPASLCWAEALDGGDPLAKVPNRDRLMRLEATALAAGDDASKAVEIARLVHRAAGVRWTEKVDRALVTEYDRARRWNTTWLMDLGSPSKTAPRKVFDLSVRDSYGDPGIPVSRIRSDGQRTLLQQGDWIFLAGKGSTPTGDRPFLDRMNLKSLKKERLFQSAGDCLESFATFAPVASAPARILTTRQSPTEPPNWFVVDLKGKERRAVTDYKDTAQITGVEKRLLTYHRADGVPLSGFLYLPAGYRAGTRLPVFVWAYPLEFSDASTAGQVRGSTNTFTRLTGPSPLFFLTQGYAVLEDATMPVVGDPETMNDTYIEQIVAAAQAAVDTLDAMGIADRDRVCIGGHSYGAFMTANLLAHSDLFAAGIARSGAYNRSLTPFGFQAERRSYWEATDIYTKISPFTYANKIDEPLLLIHGEADNNSGTFPIQSERLFQALQANGATARLVMLPEEAHGYRGRESVLHVVAEMLEWGDRWVKNAPPRSKPAAETPNAVSGRK